MAPRTPPYQWHPVLREIVAVMVGIASVCLIGEVLELSYVIDRIMTMCFFAPPTLLAGIIVK